MKKLMSITLLFVLALSLVTLGACTNNGNKEEKKIGVILYGKDDSFGGQVYAILNNAAEAIGVEIQWALNDYDAESQLASAENLVAAGAEGLLFLPISDNAVQLINTYSQQNQIYYQMMFRDISDPDIKAAAQANPYYVGTCFEADQQAAMDLVQLLADEGRLNYGLGQITPGTALAVRNQGFEDGVEAVDGTILAEYTAPADGSTQAYVTYIENFVNSYPEMDGLLLGNASAGAGETIINTLKGLVEPGDIKIVGFDIFEGMQDGFEDGWIAGIVSGMSPDALFSFIMLVNAVEGNPLAETFTVLSQKLIVITSAEDYALYQLYVDNPEHMIYDDETIRSLVVSHNEDATLQDILDLMALYSLDWVVDQATN